MGSYQPLYAHAGGWVLSQVKETGREIQWAIGGICFLLFYFIYAKYFEKEHKNSKLNYIWLYNENCFICHLFVFCFLVLVLVSAYFLCFWFLFFFHLVLLFIFCIRICCIHVKHFTIVMHNLSWQSLLFFAFLHLSFLRLFCVCFSIISICFAAQICRMKTSIDGDGDDARSHLII